MPLALFPGATIEHLTPARVLPGMPTRRLGQDILYHARLGSTNDLACERARAGAPEGLLILVEEQTAGRGRLGRPWLAPFGSGLLASLLLRPTFLLPGEAFLLTAMTALAVDEALAREAGLRCTLKWPNDLLLEGRKVCGILVELAGKAESLDWAVVGWGLNVNVDFSGDEELAGRATSLAMALGRPLDRLPLLWACLERLEVYYEALRAGQNERVWAAWRARLSTLGRPVEVVAPEGTFTGTAIDVGHDGALLVRREDGILEKVLAGDVSLRERADLAPSEPKP